jgi:hypothetical protein
MAISATDLAATDLHRWCIMGFTLAVVLLIHDVPLLA